MARTFMLIGSIGLVVAVCGGACAWGVLVTMHIGEAFTR